MNETLFLYSEIWYLATDRSGQMYIYEKEMPHRDEDEGMWVCGLNGWYQSISPGQLEPAGCCHSARVDRRAHAACARHAGETKQQAVSAAKHCPFPP